MRLTITADMLAALERAGDKPDWLVAQVARMRAEGEPYVLPLAAEQSTALEELCAMNIRFTPDGRVKPEHAALDALSMLVLENY
ncbi:MAG TPA: hypothetical protein PK948_04285 [Gemmatimonadales bacterium]|nr:hypothetical protein [Gemmatimonadales bacterium]